MNQTQCQSGHGLFRGHIQQLTWWECDGKMGSGNCLSLAQSMTLSYDVYFANGKQSP